MSKHEKPHSDDQLTLEDYETLSREAKDQGVTFQEYLRIAVLEKAQSVLERFDSGQIIQFPTCRPCAWSSECDWFQRI